MEEDAIQPAPLNSAPAPISNFGPSFSTRKPCTGDSQVCSTIRIVMVHCTSESAAPVVFWNDGTNSVQTYCGLEITIMTTKPMRSWIQRVAAVSAASRSIVPSVGDPKVRAWVMGAPPAGEEPVAAATQEWCHRPGLCNQIMLGQSADFKGYSGSWSRARQHPRRPLPQFWAILA